MADQKINGALYRSMVIEGALAIAEKKEQANELNVFPVPDGDTGTNMSMTMGSAMAEMEKLAEPSLAKAADATASALLRGARGNSGVILSLLFRGMAKKLRETDEADGRTLALALREGVDTAYKAVMKPAEGTILTVSRVAAQHAVELCQAEPTLTAEQVLAAIIEQGHTALEETVHQNPVLEKAGVVDAGGFGFITIFEGMLDALRGIHKERAVAAEPTKSTADFAAINDEDITFTDGCMGPHTENLLRDCGDFYLRRADGVFAYQLAVVVDDARMGVTEVVRGADLLSSTARQLYLYRLLGLPAPKFAHCPLLLAPDGRRLSKRDGDQSLENLRAKYTAEEIVGRLAFAYGLQPEPAPRTPESLIPDFSWDKVPKQDICLPENLF